MEEIQRIADVYNLRVVYDAAHAFAVRRQGNSVLSHGDLSILSFHATKVFNTFEGGAIICHDAKTKRRIDQLKNFGIVDETTVAAPGINGKMSEFNAALGLLQLQHIDAAIAKRRALHDLYCRKLLAVPGIECLQPDAQSSANYSYFPILVRPEHRRGRDQLYSQLKAQQIHPRRYFFPLVSDFPMYRGLPSARRENLPVAVAAADQILCLPIYPDMDPAVIDRVVSVMAGD